MRAKTGRDGIHGATFSSAELTEESPPGSGFLAETTLAWERAAREAGIPLGPSGGIAVDHSMRTQAEGVWAAGDCVESIHRLSGQRVVLVEGGEGVDVREDVPVGHEQILPAVAVNVADRFVAEGPLAHLEGRTIPPPRAGDR